MVFFCLVVCCSLLPPPLLLLNANYIDFLVSEWMNECRVWVCNTATQTLLTHTGQLNQWVKRRRWRRQLLLLLLLYNIYICTNDNRNPNQQTFRCCALYIHSLTISILSFSFPLYLVLSVSFIHLVAVSLVLFLLHLSVSLSFILWDCCMREVHSEL